MQEFIKVVDKNLFLLSTELLGLSEAQLWIGERPEGPADNEDERVLCERAEAEKHKGEPGWRISGIEAVDLTESQKYPGWFEVNTSSWMPGVYRFNIHSRAGVQAPQGTSLRPIRDGQYSWGQFSDEELKNFPDEQKQFLYLEKNKAGFCLRIEKLPDGTLKSAGDGAEWTPNWPEIKKEVEAHYRKKLKAINR